MLVRRASCDRGGVARVRRWRSPHLRRGVARRRCGRARGRRQRMRARGRARRRGCEYGRQRVGGRESACCPARVNRCVARLTLSWVFLSDLLV